MAIYHSSTTLQTSSVLQRQQAGYLWVYAAILNKYCPAISLKRFDQSENGILEASFLVDFNSLNELEKTKEELKSLSKSINITYLGKSEI